MADKRITELTEKQAVESGDFLIVDNATGGTKKITAENLLKGTLPFSPPATLNECTWAQIQVLLTLGVLGNYYNEGDTKTITLSTGEELTMQLASINDGTGDAGAYYPKNTADFVSVEVMQNSHRMNATATNLGGWNDSELRAYLNDLVYPTLPSDLKIFIVTKTHMRTEGNQSTTLISADDKLWLPTLFECYGEYSGASESANYNKQYSIFDTRTKRIKTKRGESTARWWWTSSPMTGTSSSFCLIDYYGNQASTSANDTDKNFAIGFRIGDSIDLSDYQTKIDNNLNTTSKEIVGAINELLSGKEDNATIKTATLAAGSTTVTFTGVPTTGNNLIDVYTSVAGLEYTAVDDTTAGQLTYTFEAQQSAVNVYLVIKEVS